METVAHDFSTLEVFPLNLPTGFVNEMDINLYLVKTPELNILIDTTTHYQNHAQMLQDLLTQHGIKHLDYLLLTHCHSDHAGNAQWIKKWFPEVQIVMHPVGAERLRKGSWMPEYEPHGREFFRRYYPLLKAMTLETNPQCLKYALSVMEKCDVKMRLPLIEPQDVVKQQIVAALEGVNDALVL